MTHVLLALAGGTGLLLLSGWVYQTLAAARDRRRFPPPGRLVDVQGTRFHLHETGEGRPHVILDAALGGSSMSWYRIQPELAKLARVGSYDRAGFGWSDPARRPRIAGVMAEELHGLLRTAAVSAPLVLVGHSYGCLICLVYAARHPQDVGGMVLVDPPDVDAWMHPDARQRERIGRGVQLAGRAALASRFGLMRLFFAFYGLRAPSATRIAAPDSGRPENSRIFEILDQLPADSRAVLRWLWSEPHCLSALASLIENVPDSAAEAGGVAIPSDLPLVVLTAANAPEKQRRYHQRLAAGSSRGRHVVASSSGHWIPLEEPELVIEACREVVDLVRGGRLGLHPGG